jgi:hypothetical protein
MVGWLVGGLLPLGLHVYEAIKRETESSFSTVLVALIGGGTCAVILGSILQALLLLCGVHNILGLRIDHWYWDWWKFIE